MSKRVLVVDDDADVRELLWLALAPTGWEVEAIGDGAEAIDRCRDGGVDAVLLDLEMPGLDGRQVLAGLREAPETATVPVVFVTAAAEPVLAAELLSLGASAVFGKPFDAIAIGLQVAAALGWHEARAIPATADRHRAR